MAAPDRVGQGKARIIDATKQLARDVGLEVAPLKLSWADDGAESERFHLQIAYGDRAAPQPATIRRIDLESCAYSSTVPLRVAEEITSRLKSVAGS